MEGGEVDGGGEVTAPAFAGGQRPAIAGPRAAGTVEKLMTEGDRGARSAPCAEAVI